MNPGYVLFDLAVAAIALRSLAVLRRRAPLTSIGWAATTLYFLALAYRYARGVPHPALGPLTGACFVVLLVAFVAAVVRDEPPAEPLLWPTRVGPTRAEKRRRTG